MREVASTDGSLMPFVAVGILLFGLGWMLLRTPAARMLREELHARARTSRPMQYLWGPDDPCTGQDAPEADPRESAPTQVEDTFDYSIFEQCNPVDPN